MQIDLLSAAFVRIAFTRVVHLIRVLYCETAVDTLPSIWVQSIAISVYVCLSVRSHISKTTCPNSKTYQLCYYDSQWLKILTDTFLQITYYKK